MTVLSWDTTGVEKGAQRVERAYKRLREQEDKMDPRKKGASGRGAGRYAAGGGNMGWALHDLAEGRTRNGLMRLGEAFKLNAVKATAFFAAIAAGRAILRTANEQIEEMQTAGARLQQSFDAGRLSTVAAYTTPGAGESTINSRIEELNKQAEGEKQVQVDASRVQGSSLSNNIDVSKNWLFNNANSGPVSITALAALGAGPMAPIAALLGHKAGDLLDKYQGKGWLGNSLSGKYGVYKDSEKIVQESQTREKDVEAEANNLKMKRAEALADKTTIAQQSGPGGDAYEAKRLELKLQQEEEEILAKKQGYSDAELKSIKDRYDALREVLVVEKDLAITRFRQSSYQLDTHGSYEGAYSEKLDNAQNQIAASTRLLNSGNLNEEQTREESLRLKEAQNQANDAMVSRFLNPDGTRKPLYQVQAEARAEKIAQRRTRYFLQHYDRNGKYIHGSGTPGGGETTGGVGESTDATPYNAAGADATGIPDYMRDFNDFFHHGAAVQAAAAAEAKNASAPSQAAPKKDTGDLYNLLDSRLPKATA